MERLIDPRNSMKVDIFDKTRCPTCQKARDLSGKILDAQRKEELEYCNQNENHDIQDGCVLAALFPEVSVGYDADIEFTL